MSIRSIVAALLLPVVGLSAATDGMGRPDKVFDAAIAKVAGRTTIPVRLPVSLPSAISASEIKAALDEATATSYSISLHYGDDGSDASFAAGFSGRAEPKQGGPANTRSVRLANGVAGRFRPVSCGGSCAPASLWWRQDGVTYQIQIKLRSDTPQDKQEDTVVAAANACVVASPLLGAQD